MNNVISVVTACMNSRPLIDETVLSVVTQRGNFDLQYHVQVGGSDDGTQERLQFWQEFLKNGGLPLGCRDLQFSYSVQEDRGLYDGLNNAFQNLEAGNNKPGWMTWINAGDVLQPGAVELVFQVSRDHPESRWMGGRTSMANSDGCLFEILNPYPFSLKTLKAGLHDGRKLHILQQEGVFWKNELWNEVGGELDTTLLYAGDFDLWRRFAYHENYICLNSVLGTFRIHDGQLSEDKERYQEEINKIIVTNGLKDDNLSVWEEFLTVIKSCPEELKQRGFVGPVFFFLPKQQRWIQADLFSSPKFLSQFTESLSDLVK